MYDRFAKSLSQELFNSVYTDLQRFAVAEQLAIFKSQKRKGYYVGDCQNMFSDFCKNKESLGAAMDFIAVQKAYEKPVKENA